MRVKAKVRFVRGSAQKTRRIIRLLRGKKVSAALAALRFMPQKAAKVIYKTVQAAVANAKNNFKLQEDKLVIQEIFADSAGMIKRMRARAKGRGFPIKKRLSHLTVYVAEKGEK